MVMIGELTFQKKTSSQVATSLRTISQHPEPDQGWTQQDHGPKDLYTSISVHSRVLPADIVSDQHWCQNLLKYLDNAVTFYNAGYLVGRQLVMTI
jgi:hypothetical protein